MWLFYYIKASGQNEFSEHKIISSKEVLGKQL